jgi:hypothetical protein
VSDIEKAAREAVEAADNAEMVRQIAAILAAQQLLNQQPAPVVQQTTQPFDAKKWVVIGGVAVSLGLVGAVFAIAVTIGAVCATACLLVLRGLWADYQKRR